MLRLVLVAAALLASTPVLAQTTPATPPEAARTPSPAQAAQQQRMSACNSTAGERSFKGQARKDFMSACLAGKQTPQVMMKSCNAEAKQDGLAVDARKTYLSTCLKTS